MIYDRYKDLHLEGNKVFPIKRYYKTMNMSLRHVAKHAGLSFNPTMHIMRHTFATTVTLAQGVPLETVSKMLGHKHITTCLLYTSDLIEIGLVVAVVQSRIDLLGDDAVRLDAVQHVVGQMCIRDR